uniref:Uncharacterized protein n=1 Tax=Physcomitrium patens TaxID=3218 RepID=A0A2K1KFC5_PHYPA|nr:hypothetical protein PHYPA_008854 [Physcomitrium patens]
MSGMWQEDWCRWNTCSYRSNSNALVVLLVIMFGLRSGHSVRFSLWCSERCAVEVAVVVFFGYVCCPESNQSVTSYSFFSVEVPEKFKTLEKVKEFKILVENPNERIEYL